MRNQRLLPRANRSLTTYRKGRTINHTTLSSPSMRKKLVASMMAAKQRGSMAPIFIENRKGKRCLVVQYSNFANTWTIQLPYSLTFGNPTEYLVITDTSAQRLDNLKLAA